MRAYTCVMVDLVFRSDNDVENQIMFYSTYRYSLLCSPDPAGTSPQTSQCIWRLLHEGGREGRREKGGPKWLMPVGKTRVFSPKTIWNMVNQLGASFSCTHRVCLATHCYRVNKNIYWVKHFMFTYLSFSGKNRQNEWFWRKKEASSAKSLAFYLCFYLRKFAWACLSVC